MAQRTVPVGVREQLSLAWLHTVTIAIVTVIITLFQTRSAVISAINMAERQVNSTCASVDATATKLTNVPEMLQNQAVAAIHETVADAQKTFLNVINIVQGIIEFCIGMFRSTIICLLMLVVNGAMTAVTEVAGALQSAVENLVNGAESVIDKIAGFFGASTPGFPDVTLNFTGPLQNAQQIVQNFTNNPDGLIDGELNKLFDMPRQLINQSFASWTLNIPNATIKQSNVCNTTKLMDGLEDAKKDLLLPIMITIYGLMGVIVIFTVFNCWRIRKRNRIWMGVVDQKTDEVDRESREDIRRRMIECAHIERKGWVARRIIYRNPDKVQTYANWLIDFLTHPFALYCLLLGIFGIVMVYVLLFVMNFVENDVIFKFTQVIDNWTAEITANMANSTTANINQFNLYVKNSESSLNNNTLGYVRLAATTLENVLNTTVTDIQNGVQSVFHSTFLADAIIDVLRCIILNKLENLENALEWVATNFYVTFSTIDPNLVTDAVGTNFTEDLQNSTAFNFLWTVARDSISGQLIYYWTVLGMYFTCILLAVILTIWAEIESRRSGGGTWGSGGSRSSEILDDDPEKRSYTFFKMPNFNNAGGQTPVWDKLKGRFNSFARNDEEDISAYGEPEEHRETYSIKEQHLDEKDSIGEDRYEKENPDEKAKPWAGLKNMLTKIKPNGLNKKDEYEDDDCDSIIDSLPPLSTQPLPSHQTAPPEYNTHDYDVPDYDEKQYY